MRFRALALLPVILLTQLLLAQDAKLTAGKREQLEAAISKFMAANSIPGLSAAVVENGEYAWSGGFGMADMENSVPVTARTLFRLGSVSKPLTAVAAMRLWEQGKVDLDAEIQKHCPAFPKKDAPITTRQLLGHLAGVRHYRPQANDPEIMNTTHFSNPIQDGLKMFAPDPLVSMPGTKYNYSTHGYTVIGCAIEGASGATYVDWVRNALLLPAKMIHTQVDDQYAIIPLRTRFYQKKSGTVVNADFLDSSYKIPGGGWLSSAEDLARFEARAVERGRGLSLEALRDEVRTARAALLAVVEPLSDAQLVQPPTAAGDTTSTALAALPE